MLAGYAHGELALVQITGDIHPGNSGGPVVDAAGRLVGIAVAKIRNTNIGFAIPTCQLAAVLSGRLASASVVHITDEKGIQQQLVHTAQFDDQNRIQSTSHVAAGYSGAEQAGSSRAGWLSRPSSWIRSARIGR